ncbi:unnamed protein product [Clonostachys byssicola]|uniref:Beta-lactamase-related domain-containing protein n=1 Tax=Clonostachys byssicola TaxID=160290 RepID=A0A9N9UUN0_9HYPO|nr:unnamed protein product [Clonostachys byssicola]
MTADITNWREPSHSIWGFQNANKIVPTDSIRKSSQAVKLTSKPHNFNNFRVQLPDNSFLTLPSFLSQTETDGIVVLKDGVVVYEFYDRTNTEASIHATFSISKSISGLLCGILVGQGKLNPDSLVSSYVPEILQSAYASVTVRQLLDMRAGITHDDASPGYRKAGGLYPFMPGEKPTDLHAYLPTIPPSPAVHMDGLDGPPFEYISANADLVGWVIERASGKSFAQFLSESLWQPMGAESDAYVTVDHGGNARAAAGVCVTVRDLARLGQLIVEGGRGILPESWINDMLNNGSQPAFAAGPEKREYDRVFDTVAYRSYWVTSPSDEALMASGTNGQLLFVDCKNKVVVAKTSSQPKRTDWDKLVLTVQACREFTRLLTGASN